MLQSNLGRHAVGRLATAPRVRLHSIYSTGSDIVRQCDDHYGRGPYQSWHPKPNFFLHHTCSDVSSSRFCKLVYAPVRPRLVGAPRKGSRKKITRYTKRLRKNCSLTLGMEAKVCTKSEQLTTKYLKLTESQDACQVQGSKNVNLLSIWEALRAAMLQNVLDAFQ